MAVGLIAHILVDLEGEKGESPSSEMLFSILLFCLLCCSILLLVIVVHLLLCPMNGLNFMVVMCV